MALLTRQKYMRDEKDNLLSFANSPKSRTYNKYYDPQVIEEQILHHKINVSVRINCYGKSNHLNYSFFVRYGQLN